MLSLVLSEVARIEDLDVVKRKQFKFYPYDRNVLDGYRKSFHYVVHSMLFFYLCAAQELLVLTATVRCRV